MDVIQQTAAVALVLGLLGALLWRLRRGGFRGITTGAPGGRRMQCVERVALSPHHALHLIRLGEKGILLTSSPAGCSLIGSFSWSEHEICRGAKL